MLLFFNIFVITRTKTYLLIGFLFIMLLTCTFALLIWFFFDRTYFFHITKILLWLFASVAVLKMFISSQVSSATN